MPLPFSTAALPLAAMGTAGLPVLAGTGGPPSPPCKVTPPSAPNPGHMQMVHYAIPLDKGKAGVTVVTLLLKAEHTQAAELLYIRDIQYTGSQGLCSRHLSRQLSEGEH